MADNDPVTARMSAIDAQLLWLSEKVPNDQFLLYAFGGSPADPGDAVAELHRRAERIPELRLTVRDDNPRRFPLWVGAAVTAEQFRIGRPGDWTECLATVARLPADPLVAERMTWRAHVFPDVPGIPGVPGSGSVVVVQISHALGDGVRSAALAGALLGRSGELPRLAPVAGGSLPGLALAAARAHRRMARETAAGLLPAAGPARPPLSVNARPGADRVIRTAVLRRERLPGPTVTVAVLTAVGEALGGYLRDRGEDVGMLGAEVPVAPRTPGASTRNNFTNVGVGLHPQLGGAERALRIAADLDARRRRLEHPAARAAAAAFAAVPAAVLRWGVGRFDPDARPATVSGHTVVSSVNRGPADLAFGGHPAVFTAGFPALSPVISLTHGVHGLGPVVAVSVHADPIRVDVGDYWRRLTRALGTGPECAQSDSSAEITP